jgi:hypothetical protein
MKIRAVLTLTGIVSSLLGALVVYLMLTVPNDLRADALLKQAREDLNGGQSEKARTSLLHIVQQYPRTDAAAAATAALLSLERRERNDLAKVVTQLRTENTRQAKILGDLQKNVTEIKTAPPQVVTVQGPAPKPPVPKVVPKKKTPPKKKTTTRRRR